MIWSVRRVLEIASEEKRKKAVDVDAPRLPDAPPSEMLFGLSMAQ